MEVLHGNKEEIKHLDALHFASTIPLGHFEQPLTHPGSQHKAVELVIPFDHLDLNFFKRLVK